MSDKFSNSEILQAILELAYKCQDKRVHFRLYKRVQLGSLNDAKVTCSDLLRVTCLRFYRRSDTKGTLAGYLFAILRNK